MIGAPVLPGGHYTVVDGRWRSPGVHEHVPNPGIGETTHLWDETARTFGIPPLHPLPAMPEFVPDAATFTGPNAIYARDLETAGDTLTQIVAKARAQASNTSTLYTLVLEPKVYTIRGFGDGLNKISGVDMPPNVQLWGAGSGRHGGPVTTLRLEPHTSAYDSTNCYWPGTHGTPKCQVIRIAHALPGWGIRHVRVEGGKQGTDNLGRGHPYNGIRLEECPNRVIVENVVTRAIRGDLPYPPGETGHICTHDCGDVIIRNLEMDGRELGNDSTAVSNRVSSSGIMWNTTAGVIIDVRYRWSFVGGPLAVWWSHGLSTFNVTGEWLGGGENRNEPGQIMGGGVINQERVHQITHYSPRGTLRRDMTGNGDRNPSLQFSLNNDMGWDGQTTDPASTVAGRCMFVDPQPDPTSDVNGRVTVAVWNPYDPLGEGGQHRQRNNADDPNAAGALMAVDRRGRPVTVSTNRTNGTWTTTSYGRS